MDAVRSSLEREYSVLDKRNGNGAIVDYAYKLWKLNAPGVCGCVLVWGESLKNDETECERAELLLNF